MANIAQVNEFRVIEVDNQSGEVTKDTTTETIISKKTEAEPPYIKEYITDISALTGLTNMEEKILRHLLQMMDYENRIIVTPSKRKAIADIIEVKPDSVRKACTSISNKGLLVKEDTYTFMANPYLFARGSWKSIKELRMTVRYSVEGKTIQLEKIPKGEEDEI